MAKNYRNKLLQDSSRLGKIVYTAMFIFFVLYAASLIYPLVWGLISSVKTANAYYSSSFIEFWKKNSGDLSKVFAFDNYARAFKEISDGEISFVGMLWNSLWYAIGSPLIYVESVTILSYVINKYKFRGRNFLFKFALFQVAVPIGPTFIANYRLIWDLGIANSYLILITSVSCFNMNFLLMHSFMSSISWSYAEAAQIDGAGPYTTYFKVMRKMAAPMMITMFLMQFIGKWNDYMTPLLYLPDMLTLSTGLFKYRTIVERSGNYPVLFAGLMIMTTPIMLLYGVFNKKLMGSFSVGGLKG